MKVLCLAFVLGLCLFASAIDINPTTGLTICNDQATVADCHTLRPDCKYWPSRGQCVYACRRRATNETACEAVPDCNWKASRNVCKLDKQAVLLASKSTVPSASASVGSSPAAASSSAPVDSSPAVGSSSAPVGSSPAVGSSSAPVGSSPAAASSSAPVGSSPAAASSSAPAGSSPAAASSSAAGGASPSASVTGTVLPSDNGVDTDNDRLTDIEEQFIYNTDPNNPDTDGDGIKDGDEVKATAAGLDLKAMGADPRKKNIFLEFDWFEDSLTDNQCAAPHSHRPTAATIAALSTMFANAPVSNPDGSTGISIIADYGQGGAFTGGNKIPIASDGEANINGGVFDAAYTSYKTANFNSNRQNYFHYVLMVHTYGGGQSSGQAAKPGSVVLVASYFCFSQTYDVDVANTIAHELGHNLGLGHGGNEDCNYKPNYNSIMNYRFQFPGIDSNCDGQPDGVTDYSRGVRLSIDETAINENNGMCNAPIDFNGDNALQTSVTFDLQSWNPGNTCSSCADYVANSEAAECGTTLKVTGDYNDWANLNYAGVSLGAKPGKNKPKSVTCQNHPGV